MDIESRMILNYTGDILKSEFLSMQEALESFTCQHSREVILYIYFFRIPYYHDNVMLDKL